jgi:hypothetical protein
MRHITVKALVEAEFYTNYEAAEGIDPEGVEDDEQTERRSR